MKKIIKIALLKKEVRFTFPTEQLREEYAKHLDYFLTDPVKACGVKENKKFLYLELNIIGNEEIGVAFRLLQSLGYEAEYI